jgi:hypothetical protein
MRSSPCTAGASCESVSVTARCAQEQRIGRGCRAGRAAAARGAQQRCRGTACAGAAAAWCALRLPDANRRAHAAHHGSLARRRVRQAHDRSGAGRRCGPEAKSPTAARTRQGPPLPLRCRCAPHPARITHREAARVRCGREALLLPSQTEIGSLAADADVDTTSIREGGRLRSLSTRHGTGG